MEIQEIKSRLTIAHVLQHYNLKPDKHNRICCPFHDDKTPSLQLYYKTQTAYCFSSNCPTHGKSLDVIDFIMYQEKCNKHEAILKAQDFIGLPNPTPSQPKPAPKPDNPAPTTEERVVFLNKMFTYFKNAVYNSKPAQEYITGRKLDFAKIEIGYNSGQFHHGARKDETLINECLQHGILLDLGLKSRTGDTAYKPFGKWCIVFALRNPQHEIVSLYFRSTLQNKEQRHFYLKNRQGLYPSYPKPDTKKLILTEAIIDAASLQLAINNEQLSVLACFGTNGLTKEHTSAISQLKALDEIIFFFDGDKAGKEAVSKYAAMFNELLPTVKITNIEPPESEDINSLLQGHEPSVLLHLIDNRIDFSFSNEKAIETALRFVNSDENKKDSEQKKITEMPEPTTEPYTPINTLSNQHINTLNTTNPYNLKYQGSEAQYQIKGFRIEQLDSLKITLQITI